MLTGHNASKEKVERNRKAEEILERVFVSSFCSGRRPLQYLNFSLMLGVSFHVGVALSFGLCIGVRLLSLHVYVRPSDLRLFLST